MPLESKPNPKPPKPPSPTIDILAKLMDELQAEAVKAPQHRIVWAKARDMVGEAIRRIEGWGKP